MLWFEAFLLFILSLELQVQLLDWETGMILISTDCLNCRKFQGYVDSGQEGRKVFCMDACFGWARFFFP